VRILAIDGALGAFSAALAQGGRLVASCSASGNVALERGLPMLAELFAGTGTRPGEIDRLAVGTGPGGFTGLRIALAYAKALAQAWSVPLVPLSSFDILEHGLALPEVLSVVSGRPGVVSLRLRSGLTVRRASGRTEQALGSVLPPGEPLAQPLATVAAPEDVLRALRERGIRVSPHDPLVTPAAAAALLAFRHQPARTPHEVRADYGELPAVTVREPKASSA
jgi:tRNA threonylcarbamoyladenosine biosynthesis protein TsaB